MRENYIKSVRKIICTMLVVILTLVNLVPVTASSKDIKEQIEESFTINSIDAGTTTITGQGLAGAKVSAFVGEKQLGDTVTVNGNKDYSIKIKKQKVKTKITVKMEKYNTSVEREATVLSFENPGKLVYSRGEYNVVVPTSNADVIFEPTIKKVMTLANPYLGTGFVAISDKYYKSIDSKGSSFIKGVFENLISDWKDWVFDAIDKKKWYKGFSSITEINSVYMDYSTVKAKLKNDTTDYDLNTILNKSFSYYSDDALTSLAKYNYAKTVVKELKDKGDVWVTKDSLVKFSSKGEKEKQKLRSDLNKIQVASLKERNKNKLLKVDAITKNTTYIKGTAIKDAKVTAYVVGKNNKLNQIGKIVTANSEGKFSIKIPKQKLDTKIKVKAEATKTYNEYTYIKPYTKSKVYEYYTKSKDEVVYNGAIKTPTIDKVYNTTKYLKGKTTGGVTVKAYVNDKQIGKTTTSKKNGDYTIEINKQSIGTKIQVKATKSKYKAGVVNTIALGKIGEVTLDNIYDTSTYISGNAPNGVTVTVYDYLNNEIGSSVKVDSSKKYRVEISKLQLGQRIKVKFSKKNYESKYLEKSVSKKPESNVRLPFIHNNKVGYMDETGKVMIKPKYNYYYNEMYDEVEAGEFKESIAKVYTSSGKVRYINSTGEYINKYTYDFGYDFSEGLALAKRSGKYVYIDKNGKEVFSKKYSKCYPFSDGLALFESNYKWGYIDKKGKVVIKAQFPEAQAFTNGYAIVALNGYDTAIIDKKGNNKTKGIDLNTNLINYDFMQPVVGEGLFGRYDPIGGYVFADINNPSKIKVHRGKYNLPGYGTYYDGYKDISIFSEGLAAVKLNNYKWGFVDKTSKLVIPAVYDMVSNFSDGYATAYKNNDVFVIDKSGKIIATFPDESIYTTRYIRGKIMCTVDSHGYRYYNFKGKEIKPQI